MARKSLTHLLEQEPDTLTPPEQVRLATGMLRELRLRQPLDRVYRAERPPVGHGVGTGSRARRRRCSPGRRAAISATAAVACTGGSRPGRAPRSDAPGSPLPTAGGGSRRGPEQARNTGSSADLRKPENRTRGSGGTLAPSGGAKHRNGEGDLDAGRDQRQHENPSVFSTPEKPCRATAL
jgi:hypothetical protein